MKYNKQEALERLASIENETKELKKIINAKDSYTLNDLTSYEQACKVLGLMSSIEASPEEQIKKIVKAANFIDNNEKVWNADWSNSNEYKYVPYFENLGRGRFGLDFVYFFDLYSYLSVGFFFKNRSTAELISKRFLSLYKEWITNE